MAKKYIVRLSGKERDFLEGFVRKGKAAAYKIKHANILLKADAERAGWVDTRIADAFGCHERTVRNVRRRFVTQGLQRALERKKQSRPSRRRKLDGEKEARLIAIACSEPPEGRARWTLQMLADELVRLEVVDSISDQTVRRSPKKNQFQPHRRECWLIPKKHNAAFVAAMEDILELYKRPYDPKFPLICMDEQPVQLVKEIRKPLPARPGAPMRYDQHYERAGTANIFMFTEPLGRWRRPSVTQRRTSVDWAQQLRCLLEVDYPDAVKVLLVCDNLNTHKIASFYEAFAPAVARSLVERLEIHYTPKHGSWLNVAECELSAMTRQSLTRRIGTADTLRNEVESWGFKRNASQVGIDWRFTAQDARIKLKSLYPQIQLS
ncbi:MAG: IS630 family transposase [Planctomycetes bacterium]|nr:IS630 family transposase [Planctomycetota bacterium]